MDQLPKNFKLIPIFAIVLGCLGILSAINTSWSVVAGGDRVMNTLSIKQPNPELEQYQQALRAQSAALMNRWRIPNGITGVCNLLISSGLLAGGLMTNRLRRNGRRFLSKILLVSILYDPIVMIPQLMLTLENAALQKNLSAELMKAAMSKAPSEVGDVAAAFIGFAFYVGLVFIVGWVGIKVWYYVWARKKLASPDVEELFAKHGS